MQLRAFSTVRVLMLPCSQVCQGHTHSCLSTLPIRLRLHPGNNRKYGRNVNIAPEQGRLFPERHLPDKSGYYPSQGEYHNRSRLFFQAEHFRSHSNITVISDTVCN